MTDLEIAQQLEELKAERLSLESATAIRLQQIKTERDSLVETMKRRSVGLDETKIGIAERIIEVTGKYEREGGCIDRAISCLATGSDYMKRVAISVKDYAQFSGQGCDCEYGYGPKHGWHVFTVGLTRDARKRDLTEDERDAAIYYLVHLRQIQESARQAATGNQPPRTLKRKVE
jgi:hypothetical protein